MPWVRGGWAEFLAPGLNLNTFTRLRERPEQYRRYNQVKQSTKAYEDTFDMEGFGPLAKKAELAPTMLDEPLKIAGVRFIHESFALGFLMSEEMREDEQYGVSGDLAGRLGRSARITAELYGHDVLNNGFAATKYVGRDGKALFATDHTLFGTGGVYANRPAAPVDISEAAIEAGIGSFDSMVDDRGITAELGARILLVTPSDRMLAKRLLNSAGMPGTNNNDINPLADEGITLMVSNWLTDLDAWFLLTDPDNSPLIFWWRKAADTKTWDDENADGTYHKIKQRHSVGFDDWRGAYGSPGA
jgi:phage major head subunit gpT-like protein